MPRDILPFETDETDIHEGIGPIHEIVDLKGDENTENRCPRCGYDRGERIRHTEVESEAINCRHCGHQLYST